LTGFSVDLVRRLFHDVGREVRFRTDMPWTRCVHDLRIQKSGFGMDIYEGGRWAAQMVYSAHYNTLTPQLFTLRDHPIEVEQPADLKRYKGCGIVGGAYEHYGLKNEDLDISANGYAGVVQKLKGHHCDYFVEELEVLAGLRLSHEDYLGDPEIAHRTLKGVKRPSLHLVTARDSADAALMPKLDTEIEAMEKSGEMAALWRKYAGDIPYSR
jgi:polar amino acid transport system substrate-binding protein